MSNSRFLLPSLLLMLLAESAANGTAASAANLKTGTLSGDISVRDWKSMRDDRVEKQDLDYSCGAASAATIMRQFYKMDIHERDILAKFTRKLEKNEKNKLIGYSFADLADVVKHWDLKGAGLALDFDALRELKIPVIAHLKHQGQDHFSVIRGISASGIVHLGDPSWGNRRFTRHQFMEMWATREDPEAPGKILLILPNQMETAKLDESFFKAPEGWRAMFDALRQQQK